MGNFDQSDSPGDDQGVVPDTDASLRVGVAPPAPELDSFEDERARARVHARLFNDEPAPAPTIDRFELGHKLGAGGMGTIWSAFDRRLQRRVALKFLRSQAAGDDGLIREALALARISHPNVITVFDVGRHEGRVWIAMELVEGQTLRAWARARPREHGSILAVWLAAGRGLAAIHAAGLVHRDVKPDNVLRSEDGQVRVIDFGLVRAEHTSPTATQASSDAELRSASGLVTHEGFAGTPAYAAPEQLRGDAVDARADQYAFCVSVWEALTGRRPRAEAGQLNRRVREALLRGLSESPSERFVDMPALLDALEPRRRLWVLPSLLGVALLGTLAAGFAGAFGEPSSSEDRCVAAGEQLDAVWTKARAQTLAAGFDPELGRHARAALDTWAEAWRGVARRICTDPLSDAETRAARLACLDEGRLSFVRVVSALEDPVGPAGGIREQDPEFASQAQRGAALVRVLGALEQPSRCLLVQAGDVGPSLTPDQAAESERLRDALFRVQFLDDDPLAQRSARVLEIHDAAASHDFVRLETHAALLLGHLALESGDGDETRRWLGAVLDQPELRGGDGSRVEAWLRLAEVALYLDLDHELALWRWSRAHELAGRRPELVIERADARLTRSRIHSARGELEQADAEARAAVRSLEAAGPTAAAKLVVALRRQALVADARGQADDAVELFARARAVERVELEDPQDQERSQILVNEGLALLDAGELAAAQLRLEQALRRAEHERGPISDAAARAHLGSSAVADARGRLDEARAHAEAVDAIYRELGGPEHRDRLHSLSAIGVFAFRERRFVAAAEAFDLSLRIAERVRGPDDLELAVARINLAEAKLALGHVREAERLLVDALAVQERALPSTHPDLALARKVLGAVLLERGELERAQAALEQALAVYSSSGVSEVETAETRWLLARCLAARDLEEQALAEARTAADDFATLGWSERAREIVGWIRARSESPDQPPASAEE